MRLRKTLGPMTASTAALARMTISDTVKIVSGKLVDPLPPPHPNSSASQLKTAMIRLAAITKTNHKNRRSRLPIAATFRKRCAAYAAHTRFRPACFAAYKAWSAILMRSKIVFMLELACATPMLTVAVMACEAIDNTLASTC